jgi:tight adherence protein C
MSMMQWGFLALVFVAVAGAVLVGAYAFRPQAARQRLDQLASSFAPLADEKRQFWMERIARWTQPVGRLAAPEKGEEFSAIKQRFNHAGIRNPSASAMFFGIKAVLTLLLPLLAMALLALTGTPLKTNNLLMLLLTLAALGYYLPNLVVSHLVTKRQREIFESFPDALDLMTVCVEAGLGTESALMRVAEDMRFKSVVLHDELRLVNLELRAGADRELALRNLASRTGVEEVESFVAMINQAERFGTSIAASLRVYSDVLRTKRRQRAEEAAAKIALKLLFPLIFCIFPSLMVVLLGPAMIQVYRILLPTLGGGR